MVDLSMARDIDARTRTLISNLLHQAGIMNVDCLRLVTQAELESLRGFGRNSKLAQRLLEWIDEIGIELLPYPELRLRRMKELGDRVKTLPTDFMLFRGVITARQQDVLCHGKLAPSYGSFGKMPITCLQRYRRDGTYIFNVESVRRIQQELEKCHLGFKK